jgi:hypothetical protein
MAFLGVLNQWNNNFLKIKKSRPFSYGHRFQMACWWGSQSKMGIMISLPQLGDLPI